MGTKKKSRRVGREQMLPFERASKATLAKAPDGMVDAYRNNVYAVMIYEVPSKWGTITAIGIRRHDTQPIRKWKDLQKIKNRFVGESRQAVEIFPAEDRLVDDANITWLWALPERKEMPFGLDKSPIGGAA